MRGGKEQLILEGSSVVSRVKSRSMSTCSSEGEPNAGLEQCHPIECAMARKRRASDDNELDALGRVFAQLDEAPPGLHGVEPPATILPSGLPSALIELYAH